MITLRDCWEDCGVLIRILTIQNIHQLMGVNGVGLKIKGLEFQRCNLAYMTENYILLLWANPLGNSMQFHKVSSGCLVKLQFPWLPPQLAATPLSRFNPASPWHTYTWRERPPRPPEKPERGRHRLSLQYYTENGWLFSPLSVFMSWGVVGHPHMVTRLNHAHSHPFHPSEQYPHLTNGTLSQHFCTGHLGQAC